MFERPPEALEGTEVHGLSHVMPVKTLITVFAALIVLTILTVAVSYVNFGEMNLVVAMVIALIKGSLVCLFFMHLLYDNKFNLFVFLSCLGFVTLFITFAMTDSHQYRKSEIGGQAKNAPVPTYAPAVPAEEKK